jgi:hypothetical protein
MEEFANELPGNVKKSTSSTSSSSNEQHHSILNEAWKRVKDFLGNSSNDSNSKSDNGEKVKAKM